MTLGADIAPPGPAHVRGGVACYRYPGPLGHKPSKLKAGSRRLGGFSLRFRFATQLGTRLRLARIGTIRTGKQPNAEAPAPVAVDGRPPTGGAHEARVAVGSSTCETIHGLLPLRDNGSSATCATSTVTPGPIAWLTVVRTYS